MQKTTIHQNTISDIILMKQEMRRTVMGNVIVGLNQIRENCDVYVRYEEFTQYREDDDYTRGHFNVQGDSALKVGIAMECITQCMNYHQYIYDQTRALRRAGLVSTASTNTQKRTFKKPVRKVAKSNHTPLLPVAAATTSDFRATPSQVSNPDQLLKKRRITENDTGPHSFLLFFVSFVSFGTHSFLLSFVSFGT
jgi:hypothetical protein